MDLYKLTQEVEPYVIAMRREFHANPEISFHEVRTTARIREELDIPVFDFNSMIGHVAMALSIVKLY